MKTPALTLRTTPVLVCRFSSVVLGQAVNRLNLILDADAGLDVGRCGADGLLPVVKEEAPGKVCAEDVRKQKGARTLALDAKTHNVFVVTAGFGPRPAGTADNPRPRPLMLPDSFVVL